MVDFRSRNRNYFVLLALMLLLPITGAFAFSAEFTVQVNSSIDTQGVADAKVYIWDKNNVGNYYNTNGWMVMGTTDSTGQATLTLPDVYKTTTSITDPLPNIGFLAIPPRDVANSTLTWKTAEKVFYPLSADSIDSNTVEIALDEGVKVTFKPTYGTVDNPTPGLLNDAHIYISNMASSLGAQYIVTDTEIQASNDNSWSVYWPANENLSGYIYGDGNYDNISVSTYYPYRSIFTYTGETDQVFEFFHENLPKGKVQINVKNADETINTTYNVTAKYKINYSYERLVSTINGQKEFYLPFGTYDFSIEPQNYTDAISLRPQTKVTADNPAVLDFVPSEGLDLSPVVKLGDVSNGDEAGDVSYLYTTLKVQKKVNLGGYEGWYDYQDSANRTLSSDNIEATYGFSRKFEPGVYRISTSYPYSNYPIDRSSKPYKCYKKYVSIEVDVNTNQSPVITLPQQPALFTTVSGDQPIYDTPKVAVVHDGEYPTGYQVTPEFDWNTNELFVPYIDSSRDIFIRADIAPDTINNLSEIVKVFGPIDLNATGTTHISAGYYLDSTNFVNISGDVLFDGQSYQGSNGHMLVDPIVNVNGKEVPLRQIGLTGGPDTASMEKAFASDPGYSFRMEKGKTYELAVNEIDSTTYEIIKPLASFLPYRERYVVPTTDTTKDIVLAKGGQFNGLLQHNGNPLPLGARVGVEVRPDFQDNWDARNFATYKGVTASDTPGFFHVSGLKTGEYNLSFNIDVDGDGLNLDSPAYDVQTMPLISREIFVDQTQPLATLTFNLNDQTLRWVDGQILDVNGNGVPGLKLQISRTIVDDDWSPDESYAGEMHYNEPGMESRPQGPVVFYCSTDSNGNMIDGNGGDVTLEFGKYDVFAVGIASEPGNFSYDLAYDHYNSSREFFEFLGSFEINPNFAETTVPFQAEVGIRYPVAGTLKLDGTDLSKFYHLSLFNKDLLTVGSLNENYDMPGSFSAGLGLEPGNYFVLYAPNSSSPVPEVYWSEFTTGKQAVDNLEISFNSSNLKETQINLKTDDGRPVVLNDYWAINLTLVDKDEVELESLCWMGSPSTDQSGRLKLALTDLPPELASYSYALEFNNYYEQKPVIGPDGSELASYSYELVYKPSQRFVKIEPGQDEINITYKAPVQVTVKPTTLPAGAERYIGMLVEREVFEGGFEQFQSEVQEGSDFAGKILYTPILNGQFDFVNVSPGSEYVFMAYESLEPVFPGQFYDLDFASGGIFNWQAVFRHLEGPFMVDANGLTGENAVEVAFRDVANLSVQTDPAMIQTVEQVKMAITGDPANTTGLPGWPLMMPKLAVEYDRYDEEKNVDIYLVKPSFPVELPFSELEVPVDWAIRAVFNPEMVEGGEAYYTKVDQNIFVPAEGKEHIMPLKKKSMLSGKFAFNGEPVNGGLFLFPDGATPEDESKLVQIPAQSGLYRAYLPAGFYRGYAVGEKGASQFFNVLIEKDQNVVKDVTLGEGVEISGKVLDSSDNPIYGSAIKVMRKISARSTGFDGEMFIPYPVFQDSDIVNCGPDGSFAFKAQKNVDYYLQPIVDYGYNPGRPVKISVNETDIALDESIVLQKGLSISGRVSDAAFVEAFPMTGDYQEQLGSFGPSHADAREKGTDGYYSFELFGMASAPYEIIFWPEDPTKAAKKFTNVIPGIATLPDPVELDTGYTLRGRLTDKGGFPIEAANVKVRLGLILPTETIDDTSGNIRFSIRAQTTPDDSMPGMDMINADIAWLEATTDELGRYEFTRVPDFVSAFIVTEGAVNYSGKTYARGRTPEFIPSFDADNLMKADLKLVIGGSIAGRLIDSDGQPIVGANIDAGFGQFWADAVTDEDGSFVINGLQPSPNYMVNIQELPGLAPVFRMGILVEPGNTTKLGVIPVAKATRFAGEVIDLKTVIEKAFALGLPENTGVSVIAIDNNKVIGDYELLDGTFMKSIIGETELYLDSAVAPETATDTRPFNMNIRPGLAQLGIVLHQEFNNGNRTMVSWGWKPEVAVPSEEQLATGTFVSEVKLPSPTSFGSIYGTLTHAVDETFTFNPGQALIALYPVDENGKLLPVPFPKAYTSPVNGQWAIKDVPAGDYRVKTITREHGTRFPEKVYTVVANDALKLDIQIGAGLRKIVGKVILGEDTSKGVADARVNLIPHDMVTSTDASGTFAFNMPVGSYFLPHIEVSKPGYETVRKVDFTPAVATTGIKLPASTTALMLPAISVSDSVGRVEAKVVDNNSDPMIGAEITMIIQTETGRSTVDGNEVVSYVYVPADVQQTDESGRAVFASVPLNKDVKFRARAFYHEPLVKTLAAADNTGNSTMEFVLQTAKPKVFYRGRLFEETDGTFSLKANFDFNRPVTLGDLGFSFNEETAAWVPSEDNSNFAYPDKIGSQIMAMRYNNSGITKPEGDNSEVLAKVFYEGLTASDLIGRFNVFEGSVFRLETEVDPTAEDGFDARQTDDSGNKLPAGINVPPGMLDPEIATFGMTVEEQTDDPVDIDGEIDPSNPPKLAGPRFKFNFGGANFGAGTQHQGLFEITIAYDGSTNFEPRWYDETNQRWSKVGIIKDSIKVDYPEDGYVTFKVSHLTEFAAIKNIKDALIALKCDFNQDSKIDNADLFWLNAAQKVKSEVLLGDVTYDIVTIKDKVSTMYPTGDYSDPILPDDLLDDTNGDGKITNTDLMVLFAYQKLKSEALLDDITIDENTVAEKASGILGESQTYVETLPGSSITRD